MPQNPQVQAPTGHLVSVPGGGFVWVENGQNEADVLAKARQTPSLPMTQTGLPGKTDLTNISAKDVLNLLGTSIALGGGMVTGPAFGLGAEATMPLRMAATGIGGAVANPDNPVVGAGNQMLMEAGGAGAGQLIPRAATAAGYLLGGLKPKNLAEAVKAVMEQRALRGFGRAIVPGNEKALEEAIGAGNARLATAKANSPVNISLADLAGAGDEMIKNAPNLTETPVDFRRAVQKAEDEFLTQQYQARTSLPVPRTIPPRQLATAVSIPAGEATDLKVNLNRKGESVVKARKAGEFVPQAEDTRGTLAANIAKRAKTAVERGEAAANIPDRSSITGANRNLAQLHTIGNAEEQMSNASMLTRAGIMASRGGLGAGIGSAVSHMLGAPPGMGAAIGGTSGLFLLSPRGLSTAGMAAGRVAESTPSAIRIADIIQQLQDDYNRLKGGSK